MSFRADALSSRIAGVVLPVCAVLLWSISAGWGAELSVGPGQEFSRIEPALAAAQPGDTILVHLRPNNASYEQVALNITRPRLAIRGVASEGTFVHLSGRGFDYSGRGSTPRAIIQFNKNADDCLIEGFELFGAHNSSHNGAGVRITQANRVTVRRCVIRSNDMGIMSNGDGTPQAGADQLIERCLIHSNGDPTHPGYNHNLYLGGTSVTLLGCEIHSSLTGHNVKSRAHRTTVLACYVHDAANREFDLVDARGDTTAPGSDAMLAGNIIVKAKDCTGNRGVIHFGQDGGHEHDGTLYLVHNTIVTPFISPVVHLSADRAKANLLNNLVWNAGLNQRGQALLSGNSISASRRFTGKCNWLSPGFAGSDFAALGLSKTTVPGDLVGLPFVNPDKGDYRFAGQFAAVTDAAAPLSPEIRKQLGRPLPEYVPAMAWRPRNDHGNPDLGAHEFNPGNPRPNP